MPMPTPNANESQTDFIRRCAANPTMNEDYPDQAQRVAVCYRQWRAKSSVGETERKSFTGVELKKDKAGQFTARIATLNVVDKDGDVTLPGAFPAGKAILISAYQHGSWSGGLPVGKGMVRENGQDVLVDGEFNLNTETGKEHYETVKFAPELQEWSYGFKVLELDEASEWADNPKVWRVFKRLEVFEASPVLRGAGVNTGTLDIKSEGLTYAQEAETVLAAVGALGERSEALAALRKSEGRPLSTANKARLAELLEKMDEETKRMRAMLAEAPSGEGQKALLQLLKTYSEINGGIN